MKTSEFRRKVERMGYSTITDKSRLRVFSNEILHATIIMDRQSALTIDSSRIDFIKICIEYAETPHEDREEVNEMKNITQYLETYVDKLIEEHDHCQRIAEIRVKNNNSFSAMYWQDKSCHIRTTIKDLKEILNKGMVEHNED